MTVSLALKLYALAFGAFIVIDLVWLGLVANGLYRRAMGHLMRDTPNWPVAIGFYLLFVAGLTYFAIAPAVTDGGVRDALVAGALYGLFTYATFDLTCWAVLDRWPAWIVPIDIAWGTTLGASVAAAAWLVNDATG
ncbi:MAG: DUF2177 family protein [Thermoleophilia bacterium]|nr:DUF2177 family protein [Thermoleophilia bacterium]